MSDVEYRQLVRDYATSKDETLADEIVRQAIRGGFFDLPSMRRDGISWNVVKKHVYLLNQKAILAPDEVEEYKKIVLETMPRVHPGFVSGPEFFVPASAGDSWAPAWPGSIVSMHIYFYGWAPQNTRGMSLRKIRKLKIDPALKEFRHLQDWFQASAVKVTFWGMDDTGMEQEYGPMAHSDETIVFLDNFLRRIPQVVSQSWLRDNGFTFI